MPFKLEWDDWVKKMGQSVGLLLRQHFSQITLHTSHRSHYTLLTIGDIQNKDGKSQKGCVSAHNS